MVRTADGMAALDGDEGTWGDGGGAGAARRAHVDPQKEHGRHGATAHETPGEGRT